MSTFPPASLRSIVAEVVSLLKSRAESVCVAETAAGGLISATILACPSTSRIYRGGLTLYTFESRFAFAGWTQANVDGYTGPTPEIVKGMAENVREKLDATYCICESGTAGPSGGNTKNRTPGYVALALAKKDCPTVTREVETSLGGDREANMVRFAEEGLKLLKDEIKLQEKL